MARSGPSARFIVVGGVAGFVIGKGGARIRTIKEESGANLQFRNAEEEPFVVLNSDERVLEIRGSPEQRDKAVRAVFAAIDDMQDPPREMKMLVSTTLESSTLDQAAASASATLSLGMDTRLGSPEPGEVVATLQGVPPARLAAATAILGLVDAQPDGDDAGVRLMQQQQQQQQQHKFSERAESRAHASPVSTEHRPKETEPSTALEARHMDGAEEEEERRTEPETGKDYTFAEFKVAFASQYTETEIQEYWRDACKPVERKAVAPPRDAERAQTPQLEQQQEEQKRQMEQQQQQQAEERRLQEQQRHEEDQRRQEDHRRQEEQRRQEDQQRQDEQRRQRQEGGEREELRQQQQREAEAQRRRREEEEHQEEQRRKQETQQRSQAPWQAEDRLQAASQPSAETKMHSFNFIAESPQPVQSSCGSGANNDFLPSSHLQSCPPMSFGSSLAWTAGFPGHGSFGTFGMHAAVGGPQSQLQLLLPEAVVQRVLVPSGQMGDIARGCRVQIDLCDRVDPDRLRVVLTGGCVANSLASLALQWRIWFAQGATGTV